MHDHGCLVSDEIQEIVTLSPRIHHCFDEYNQIQQIKEAAVISPILIEKSHSVTSSFIYLFIYLLPLHKVSQSASVYVEIISSGSEVSQE